MKTPLVSIIVPVYRVEKYLPRCIDSILSQSFTNFEVILVDDGSPDNSGRICDKYALKDKRIVVFHQHNGGVSSARNLGLDKAQGKWVIFIDSDDWIEYDLLEIMMNHAMTTHADVMMFGCKIENPENNFTQKNTCVSGLYSVCSDAFLAAMKPQVWNYFFKLSHIKDNSLKFDTNIHFGEDVLFIDRYLKTCTNVFFEAKAMYVYNVYNQSTTSYINLKNNEEHLIVADLLFKSCKNNNVVTVYWIVAMFFRFIGCLANDNDVSLLEKKKILDKKFFKYRFITRSLLNIPLKYKMKLKYPFVFLLYLKCIR